MLPPRISKKPKRATRWRSPAHTTWIRGFACAVCGSTTNIAAAHVRLGSHTGLSQKPDDWRTVPLCDGSNANSRGQLGCHDRQHMRGERSFWASPGEDGRGPAIDVEDLIAALIGASPKRRDIEQIMRERANV